MKSILLSNLFCLKNRYKQLKNWKKVKKDYIMTIKIRDKFLNMKNI